MEHWKQTMLRNQSFSTKALEYQVSELGRDYEMDESNAVSQSQSTKYNWNISGKYSNSHFLMSLRKIKLHPTLNFENNVFNSL